MLSDIAGDNSTPLGLRQRLRRHLARGGVTRRYCITTDSSWVQRMRRANAGSSGCKTKIPHCVDASVLAVRALLHPRQRKDRTTRYSMPAARAVGQVFGGYRP